MTLLSLPLRDSKIICLHYHRDKNRMQTRLILSKNQFYKHNQMNKVLPSAISVLFCSDSLVLIFSSRLSSTIYFRGNAKVFDLLLSEGYNIR